jgi:hypothetical protein
LEFFSTPLMELLGNVLTAGLLAGWPALIKIAAGLL